MRDLSRALQGKGSTAMVLANAIIAHDPDHVSDMEHEFFVEDLALVCQEVISGGLHCSEKPLLPGSVFFAVNEVPFGRLETSVQLLISGVSDLVDEVDERIDSIEEELHLLFPDTTFDVRVATGLTYSGTVATTKSSLDMSIDACTERARRVLMDRRAAREQLAVA